MSPILLLENNERDRRLFGDVLSRAGHEVFGAGHALDGIRPIRQVTPRLVITGLQQPEFSELDFVR